MNGNLTVIAAGQVFVMFLLILTGFVAVKASAVPAKARSSLSDLLVNIVLPAMIINSYVIDFDPSILPNLLRTLTASIVAQVIVLLLSVLICIKIKNEDMPLMRIAMAFGNAGYMGFPLIRALFGSEGILYASIFLTVFNLLLWTIGVHSVEREKGSGGLSIVIEVVKNPVVIAVVIGVVIYFARIPVPDLILQPIQLLGNMNTPLSMFITGMIMAGGGILKTLRDMRLWECISVRLILSPLLALLLCRLMGIGGMVGAVVILLSGCPSASVVSVFAVKYHYDESLGAGLVVISTLLSILTLPVLASFI